MKPALPTFGKKARKRILDLASFFNVEGGRGDKKITEGQIHIFGAIVLRKHNRVQIICSTQYGKSLWVALAALILTCV